MKTRYQDDIADEDLLVEAIVTCESYFEHMNKEELFNHSRPLAIAYLALKYQITNLKVGILNEEESQ